MIVDLDSTLATAHSDKELAQPTHKRTLGFSPMCVFVDHGERGTGEPLILHLRPGKVSPWSTDDHIAALDRALHQLPAAERAPVLVRTDSGGCSKAFLHHITDAGLEHSIGFPAHKTVKGGDRGDSRAGVALGGGQGRRSPRRRPGRRADRMDADPDQGPPVPARRTGPPGCGSSSVVNGHIPVRNYG